MDFTKVDIERAALVSLLKDKEVQNRVLQGHKISETCFGTPILRLMFSAAVRLLHQEVGLTKRAVFNEALKSKPKDISKDDLKTAVIKIWKVVPETGTFDFYTDELLRLARGRNLVTTISGCIDLLKREDLLGAIDLLTSVSTASQEHVVEVIGSNVVEGLPDAITRIKAKKLQPERYKAIPTSFPIIDKTFGGMVKKRFNVIVGHTKRGKSMMLMEMGYQAAIRGYFVVHVTIEIPKEEAEERFYSRLTDIPLDNFTLGNFSDTDFEQLNARTADFDKQGGIYEVEAFLGGTCTVPKIALELKRLERKYDRAIDVVTVDQLNNMNPVGRHYDSNIEWSALGEISLDLFWLARDFEHIDDPKGEPTGLRMWSAAQAKPASCDLSILGQKDIAYSPLIAQNSSITFYLSRTPSDNKDNMTRLGIMFSRHGYSTGQDFLYPDFSRCKIHDVQRENIDKITSR